MLRNGLEPWHLLVVGVVVILVFGSRKLPDTARALGKSMRILKSEARAMKEDGTADEAPGTGRVPAAPGATTPGAATLGAEVVAAPVEPPASVR